jgi:hypothetical protein
MKVQRQMCTPVRDLIMAWIAWMRHLVDAEIDPADGYGTTIRAVARRRQANGCCDRQRFARFGG